MITHFIHPHTGKQFPINSVITCTLVYHLLKTLETEGTTREHKSATCRNDYDYLLLCTLMMQSMTSLPYDLMV